MFTLTRILLCLAVSLSLAGACAGQNRKKKSDSPQGKSRSAEEPEEIPILSAVGILGEPTEVRHVGAAEVSYYGPPANLSAVTVELPEIYRGQGRSVDLSFHFSVVGRKIVKPDHDYVNMMFDIHGAKLEAERLMLEADGRQFSFDKSDIDTDGLTFQFSIDFPSFGQIANSKSVKVNLGQLKFELTDDQREAMRDLLRAIGAPAKKP